MPPILSIQGLAKTYASGLQALQGVHLDIHRGELFALLGPNGAGKTTLIGAICGLIRPTSGRVLLDGQDIAADYRSARQRIGLVPQELATDMFETVWAAVRFSRGLFGRPDDDAYLEQLLRDLSLFEKRDSKMMTLSGGMKRRVLIAKALSHEPELLFLDEPTAGVDVKLRRDMWTLVSKLRERGVTIILTTHYLEEAEEMADRIGIINKGSLILVEEKAVLMKKLGERKLTIELSEPLAAVPPELAEWKLTLAAEGRQLQYRFEGATEVQSIPGLLQRLGALGLGFKDLKTETRSLEEIFVRLVEGDAR